MVAGAIAAALLALWWRHQAPRQVPSPESALDPQTAYSMGLALGRQGRHLASIPYFRRALDSPQDSWEPHADYGSALFNASFQIGIRAGRPCAVTRSSWERIAYVREALRQIEAAERLAQRPADLALLETRRAVLMRIWGLPWDALLSYRRAQSAVPEQIDFARQANDFVTYMRAAGTPGAAAAETLLVGPP
jgi:tetratricopeptide (TPR) repeat protein